MRLIALVAAVLIVVTAPAYSQQDRGGEKGSIRGFVYQGRLAAGDGPLRWADYPVVSHVYSGSPAQAAGLQVGDVILRVNGRDGTDTRAYRAGQPGSTYSLVVQRGFRELQISYVLVEPTWLRSEWTPHPGAHQTSP